MTSSLPVREITLRYPGTCRCCGKGLPVGVRAMWSSDTRATSCVRCDLVQVSSPATGLTSVGRRPGQSQIKQPAPGASARSDVDSPWQQLVEYHRQAVARAGVAEPTRVSRRETWRVLSLEAEALVTGVADALALTDVTRELFASTVPGESVYYGWPVMVVVDRKGAQCIAPVIMTELERPEAGAGTVVARDDQP